VTLLHFITSWIPIAALVLLIALALFAVDRVALWIEARGWIYWRKVKPKGGGMSRTLTSMQAFVEPEIQHVIEERQQQSALSDDFSGQPQNPNVRVTFPPPADHRGENDATPKSPVAPPVAPKKPRS
jgi:hypothetical protein